MHKTIPNKLQVGDEIRVIAPSRSMKILGDNTITLAKEKLESLGFKVTFGKNTMICSDASFLCSSIEQRVEDIIDAYKDKNVKAIFTAIGGFNVNQILSYIDYNIIKENPKIICGYSDITALLTAIYTKTGQITYYGPHFSSFAMQKGLDYTVLYNQKALLEKGPIELKSSEFWSDDLWFIDQEKRNFIKNEGMKVINNGQAKGTIIGGNLCTLNLLQGTSFMPKLDDIILFIEDDEGSKENFDLEFDRHLTSLVECLGKDKIKGMVIGRAQKSCQMTYEKWQKILTKEEFKNIPIVIDADFGHTSPICTFPIGGSIQMDVSNDNITITFED